jgi:hypothetical protein
MSERKIETLTELMARLNHLERLATDEHDIVLFQALLHAELPRITKSVAALMEFVETSAGMRCCDGDWHDDGTCNQQAKKLLARIDKDETCPHR